MENSNIEEYISTADFKNDKMLTFIFRGMCEAKEKRSQRPLTIEELDTFRVNLQDKLQEDKFSKNDCFNLVLAYRYTEYERKNGKQLKPREKIFYANELAKELGVEEDITKAPYIIAPRDGKIAPTDKRTMLGHSALSKARYNRLFKQMADGDKLTIKGFKTEMFSVPPKVKRQMALKTASIILMGVLAAAPIDTIGMKAINASNALVYAKQIDDYETRIDTYTDELKNMNLTDLQLIMKIIDDMHTNISGYDNPKIDAMGYWRLDVGNNSSTGVCRNMSDHVAYIMNNVNPNYHARNMLVRMDTTGIDIADIDRKVNFEYADALESRGDLAPSFISNHDIVVFDVPDKDYNLVVDPTNPSVGVLADGKIIMLNDMEGSMTYTPISELTYGIDYHIGIIKNLKNMNEHSTATNIDLDTLKAEWGKEAQDRALHEARAIPDAIQMAQDAYNSTLNSKETTSIRLGKKDEVKKVKKK